MPADKHQPLALMKQTTFRIAEHRAGLHDVDLFGFSILHVGMCRGVSRERGVRSLLEAVRWALDTASEPAIGSAFLVMRALLSGDAFAVTEVSSVFPAVLAAEDRNTARSKIKRSMNGAKHITDLSFGILSLIKREDQAPERT